MLDENKGSVSVDDFCAATATFGLKSSMLQCGEQQAKMQKPSFSGSVGVRQLESGIQFSQTDLLSHGNVNYDIIMPRSICLLISIDGQTSEINQTRNQQFSLKTGQAAFLNFSDEAEVIGALRDRQHTKSVLIQLREDVVRDKELQELIHKETHSSCIRNLGLQPQILQLGKSLIAPNSCGVVGKMMSESHAHEAIARSLKLVEDRPKENCSRSDILKMNIIKEKLHAHPEMDYSLADLAHEAGLSITSLKTKFRAIYGKPVFEYLRDIRMERARQGIVDHGWSVKHAAFFTGYKYASNFSAAFQKKFGYRPSRYR
ncbi:helix-turn-helix transcriptional regulator [Amylibacter sp. SFDW26]|uniref:helix-turn-helix transcriptional regulator n=1 Tax=Amylibacter sp. SFDW26 TaxID=2652722 RepID=UPI0012623C3C|nr:helix-turn-helix transcriptional regulator [Amylibacter sp. SFDW26]KAB7610502.1 helix-turn-helix transcriptional regulator [Amylibacter sp. SFDW26]